MHHAVVLLPGAAYDLGGHWNGRRCGGEVPVGALEKGKSVNKPRYVFFVETTNNRMISSIGKKYLPR